MSKRADLADAYDAMKRSKQAVEAAREDPSRAPDLLPEVSEDAAQMEEIANRAAAEEAQQAQELGPSQ